MSQGSCTRRDFLSAASVAGAAAMLPVSGHGAQPTRTPAAAQVSGTTRWVIGCHTRPFGSFRASQADTPDYILDSIKGAGSQVADFISAAPPAAGRGGAPGTGGTPAGRGGRGAAVTPEMLVHSRHDQRHPA